RAPMIIGWVGMGFPIGDTLLKDMKTLSGLDVVLMLRTPQGDWNVSHGTLAKDQWQPVAAAWQSPIPANSDGTDLSLLVQGDEYSGHQVVLPGTPGQPPVTALLLRSVDQALAPYSQLKLTLLLLSAIGI